MEKYELEIAKIILLSPENYNEDAELVVWEDYARESQQEALMTAAKVLFFLEKNGLLKK